MKKSIDLSSGHSVNGWANRETWNVALWIQNDELLYSFAKFIGSTKGGYCDFMELIDSFPWKYQKETGDGIAWSDPKIKRREINHMLKELS